MAIKIAVASGKGGTGKTTIATNLAYVLSNDHCDVAYIDCDVEEPNGHLFLKPTNLSREDVTVSVPVVDEDRCGLCGLCGQICQYSAIVCVGHNVLVFPDMCHSCGGCKLVCPSSAITEVQRSVGYLEKGLSKKITFLQGVLRVGEAMSTSVLKKIKELDPQNEIVIYDAPPGTSCPVVETLQETDFVLLVTEPTPFGLHDLQLAVKMVRKIGIPLGVVINKADSGFTGIHDYCGNEDIPILSEIPNHKEIAQLYSRGTMLTEQLPRYQNLFLKLYQDIINRLQQSEVQAI